MKEIYQILSGALGQEVRLNQIANNLANVSTPGFKQDRTVFLDYFKDMVERQGDAASAAVPDGMAPGNPTSAIWPTLGGTYINQAVGTMQPTGRALDVALDGEGFFQVQVEGQSAPLLTRAGNFLLNTENELVTPAGYRVLDEGGKPIRLDLQSGEEPRIGADGSIAVGNNNAGKLAVVTFDDTARLEKFGDGLMRAPEDLRATALEAPRVRQGSLEGSNVNAVGEMIDMIEVERAYQVQQKAMQTIDELVAMRIQAARGQ